MFTEYSKNSSSQFICISASVESQTARFFFFVIFLFFFRRVIQLHCLMPRFSLPLLPLALRLFWSVVVPSTQGSTPSEILTKIWKLWLQGILLDMSMYPLGLKGSRLSLEAQKRLGKSGIRTLDPSKTNSYEVKSGVFQSSFLLTTLYYVDGT